MTYGNGNKSESESDDNYDVGTDEGGETKTIIFKCFYNEKNASFEFYYSLFNC